MFDEIQRELQRLERGVSLSIELPIDEFGYIDRACPSDKCGVYFKVLDDHWFSEKVSDEVVYCPFCRHQEPADEWTTPEQDDYVESYAMAHVEGRIDRALSSDSRKHGRQQRSRSRGALIDISMHMNYRPGPRRLVVPPETVEILRQEFTCDECECQWTSLGASFFCPGCGHNSAVTTFDRSIEVVRATVAGLPSVREALAKASNPETAEDAIRQLREDQFSRLVGAFERLSEALFDQLPNATSHPKKGNVFQRVDGGSKIWHAASGQGYDCHLTAHELDNLAQRLQQRHILGHKQGIVDERYIDQSGDRSYVEGQRLVIREHDVLELADLVQKLSAGLRRAAEECLRKPSA